MRFIISLIFCGLSIMASAKIVYKYGPSPKDALSLENSSFCDGSIELDAATKNVAWDMEETLAPNSEIAEKKAFILTFMNCLKNGLKTLSEHNNTLETLELMIPQGLFVTEEDGKYEPESGIFLGKDESASNFNNFIEKAAPLFQQYFTKLKVYVWIWNW